MGTTVKRTMNAGCGVVFGLVFVAAGSAVFYFLTILPTMRWQAAQEWRETPCEIISSEVGTHSSKKSSSTYSIDITYRYEVDGATYTSDQYNFNTGSSSGYDSKRAVVDQYPPGLRTVCFVDPADPNAAILSKEWTWMYALGSFGLIFVLVGISISFSLGRKGRAPMPDGGRYGGALGSAVQDLNDPSPRVLSSTITPSKTLAGSLFFALIWYGVLGGVGWAFLHDGLGWDNAMPAAIVSIMALFGLIAVAGVVKGFLGLWNPQVHLRMDPGILTLGGTVIFTWELEGDASRLQNLKVYLQGKESATYRRGTDTTTDHSVFEKFTIAEANTLADFQAGRVEFAMPEFTMHTLDLPNNKISWVIRIEGSIPKWPDVEAEFPINVLPLPVAQGGGHA